MKLSLLVAAILFLSVTVFAATEPIVNYSWTPPKYGTPVDYYVVQWEVAGLPWVDINTTQDTFGVFEYMLEYGIEYRIRVKGVDAEERSGPWSPPSNMYTPDAGPPGIPSKPHNQ